MHCVRIGGLLCVAAVAATCGGNTMAQQPPAASELVRRNRVALNLEGAELIMKEAQSKARTIGKNVNIAIVDDGGHPILFARMNQARPASSYTAMTKAIAAATLRNATGPFKSPEGTVDALLNFSLQNAASSGGGRMTSLYGGVPIVVDEQVIGAVGVGGGTGPEDAEIAKAGIEALLQKLK